MICSSLLSTIVSGQITIMAEESNIALIDIEAFIIEIQNRPVLWDQTRREYSDRNLKKQAWEEVCNLFIEDFAAKTVKQKNESAVKIQKKWKGLRDAYTRDKNKKLKSGSGASTSKDYLYSHLLSFLDPMTRTRPLQSPGPETSDFDDPTNTDDGSTKSSKRAKKSNNDAEDKLIQILLQRMDYKHQNKDRSGESEPEYNFALSLVDDLKAIHPDYKFDARMEILGILKKYKQMSNYSQNYSGYYTTPQPPQNVTSQPAMSSTSTNDDNNNTETSIYDNLFTED